jgi:hypothetical protein
MVIEDLLKELGRRMGVPLELDRNRACRLVFDERWTIDIEAPAERPGTAFVYAVVGAVPVPADAAFYRGLLEANLFGRETEGATLCVDALRGEILLQRILAVGATDLAALVEALEALIRALAAWQERLATLAHAAPARAGAPLPPGGAIRV